ncbi:MAG TPA: F0F1 ATP synthase subunit epsilon [Ktedonobacteraceae bacterium]|nr:F0F1 ATP synthase subunit epsilon [Ktedonobacteraceae bacterium]
MATHATMHVEVVTAERELYNGEADELIAPGTEGMLGILPRHAALLSTLKAGELRIKLNGSEQPLFISGGFLEVSNNQATVLADTAEHAEEIDQARAEEARRRAQERLAQTTSNTERAEMQAALQRAIERLRISDITRRRRTPRIEMPQQEQ